MRAGFGMEVTVISTSPKKEKEARQSLGADHFVVSKDEAQMSVRLPDHPHAWHRGMAWSPGRACWAPASWNSRLLVVSKDAAQV